MKNKLNIAFVDDERDIHTIFRAHFRNEIRNNSVDIYNFSNGKECIDFLRKNRNEIKIILLLSDLNMPIMDGFTLTEIVTNEFPHIEVFILSAYGSDEYIKKAKGLGASKFYTKPINFSSLKSEILDQFSPQPITN